MATFIGIIGWSVVKRCARRVAKFINAEPDEIGFTTNTSSGMNLIVDALQKHGEVVSCDLEFPVTTIPWMHRRIPVHIVKSVDGVVRSDELRAAMNTQDWNRFAELCSVLKWISRKSGRSRECERQSCVRGQREPGGGCARDRCEAHEDRCALLDRAQVDVVGVWIGFCVYQ